VAFSWEESCPPVNQLLVPPPRFLSPSKGSPFWPSPYVDFPYISSPVRRYGRPNQNQSPTSFPRISAARTFCRRRFHHLARFFPVSGQPFTLVAFFLRISCRSRVHHWVVHSSSTQDGLIPLSAWARFSGAFFPPVRPFVVRVSATSATSGMRGRISIA